MSIKSDAAKSMKEHTRPRWTPSGLTIKKVLSVDISLRYKSWKTNFFFFLFASVQGEWEFLGDVFSIPEINNHVDFEIQAKTLGACGDACKSGRILHVNWNLHISCNIAINYLDVLNLSYFTCNVI